MKHSIKDIMTFLTLPLGFIVIGIVMAFVEPSSNFWKFTLTCGLIILAGTIFGLYLDKHEIDLF